MFFGAESVLTEQSEVLAGAQVDAVAGDSVLNGTVEQMWAGALVVTAIDTPVELGGLALDQDEEALPARLADKVDYLTDERNIGSAEWRTPRCSWNGPEGGLRRSGYVPTP